MIGRNIPDIGYLGRDVHEGFGFAQVVRTGPFVHLAGIAPVTGPLASLSLVGGGDAAAQLGYVLEMMRKMLASEGLGLEALASWMTYCTDISAVLAAWPALVPAFVGENRPVNTVIGVTELFLPGQLVEISAIAYDGP